MTVDQSPGRLETAIETLELSVVIPCLNEADTLEKCVAKARTAMSEAGIVGEIVVADNGSTDGSPDLALKSGARVVPVASRGYGYALMAGIEAAQGRYVLMGDADDSYDFLELPKFVEKLREGYDIVQGCRLPSGGGTIKPDAMPLSHRWFGNPLFSWLARSWFGTSIHDVYCGMRAFRKSHYLSLDQRCTGMEFATEMIIKSALRGARVAEVPITLHKDGRISHPPHLRTLRDGWRTLRFFLLYSPLWLFLLPSAVLMCMGLLGYVVAMPGVTIHGITFDAHTLLFSSLAILCSQQLIVYGIFTTSFAIGEGLRPDEPWLGRVNRIMTLERGLLAGTCLLLLGMVLLVLSILQWKAAGFGHLDYPVTMRWVIPGATLTALGLQTVFSSFFLSVLSLRRR